MSLTYCRYAIRTINMYNDILRIRTMYIAIMLSGNSGVVLPVLLLCRISTRYARC